MKILSGLTTSDCGFGNGGWADSDPTFRIAHVPFCIGDGNCELPTAARDPLLSAPWGFVKGRYR